MYELPPGPLGPDSYADVLDNVAWLLGGPIPVPILKRMRTDPGVLYTLCSGMTAREHWGGEAFWSGYRERFREAANSGLAGWPAYYLTRSHQAELRLLPAER
jgi:hypothetical protein